MDGQQDRSIPRFFFRATAHGERPLTADQHLTRRLAAILAADVVGYTRLMGEGSSAWHFATLSESLILRAASRPALTFLANATQVGDALAVPVITRVEIKTIASFMPGPP